VIAANVENPPMSQASHRAAFFRQSGWMMIATVAGGVFMYAVHMAAKQMPKVEYGVFITLLNVVTLMGIPAIGLQTIFAQQSAAALTPEDQRSLAGVFRSVLRAIFLIWLVMAAVVFVFRHQVLEHLKISNPAALLITVVIALAAMWFPIMMGLLQGRQNFLWLGWASIFNGVGRFIGVCIAVLLLGAYAAGAMTGVLVGLMTAVVIGAWHNRDYWHIDPKPMAWNAWLRRVVPLTLGLGASMFMLSADMIFVQSFFSEKQTAFYGAAGMIGRALVFFTQPLTAVMFPKVVQSAARAEKTDVLAQALAVTALAGGAAAIGCTIFPSLPLRIVYDASFLKEASPLVPWFAWCMLPLTLSNVLINGLLARAQFRAVPWLAVVALGYGVALYFRHDSFPMVIRTLGFFGILLLAVCAWFTWGPKSTKVPNPPSGSHPA
jgi:O-antigen/teichoic acid export membrane protein